MLVYDGWVPLSKPVCRLGIMWQKLCFGLPDACLLHLSVVLLHLLQDSK